MQRALFNIGLFKRWRERLRLADRTEDAHEPELLARCLNDLDERGWNLGEYLSGKPDLPASVPVLLRAAGEVRGFPKPTASSEFRARARARFESRLQAGTSRPRWFDRARRLAPRGALAPIAAAAAAVLLLGVTVGGVGTASASSLPGTPFYPAKLVLEQIQLFVAYSPELEAQTHLKIASARLAEADAENKRGDQTMVDSLLKNYQQEVVDARAAAATVPSPSYHSQVDRQVATLDAKRAVILTPAPVVNQTTIASVARPGHDSQSTPTPAPTAPPTARPARDHSEPTVEIASPIPEVIDQASKQTGPTPRPDSAKPKDRPAAGRHADAVSTLISRALAGDERGTSQALAELVGNLRSAHDLKPSAIALLRQQRTELRQALANAPATTAPRIQQAIRAIDSILGDTSLQPNPSGNNLNGNGPGDGSEGDGSGDGNSWNGGHQGQDGHQNGSGRDH